MSTDRAVMEVLALLAESRRREWLQTRFYRALAAEAEERGLAAEAERLNDLHADEQHHLSRLTARILELGGEPEDLAGPVGPSPEWESWEAMALSREKEELGRYRALLEAPLDETTRKLVLEILRSEEQQGKELRGKWMPA